MNYRLSILTATLLLSLFPAQGIQAQRGQPQGIAPTDFLDILRNPVSRQDNHEISVLFPQKPGFWSGVLAQATEEQKTEAERLFEQGIQYDSSGKYPEAIDSFQRSFVIFEEIGDRFAMARALNSLGIVFRRIGKYPEAIDYLQRALGIFEEIDNPSGIAAVLHGLGAIYDYSGKYPEAIESFQRALAIAEAMDDPAGMSRALNSLGIVSQRIGKYQETIDYFQRALNIKEEIGDRYGMAFSLNNLGTIYQSLGQYEEAIDYYQRSQSMFEEVGDPSGVASAWGNLGRVYENLGEYQNAIEHHQRALALFEEIGVPAGVAASLNNLGFVYQNLGEYENAIDAHQRSLGIKEEIGDRSGIASSLNNLGDVYQSLREYENAIDYYQRALAINEDIGEPSGIANSLIGLGSVYKNTGKYQEALDYYQRALAINEDIGDPYGISISLRGLGAIYNDLGQYSEALSFHQRSLAIVEEIGDPSGIASSLNDLGNVYESLEEYEQARDYYQRSLAINEDIGNPLGVAIALNDLGNISQKLGESENALDFHQRSLAINEDIGDPGGVANSWNNLGIVYESLEEYEKAIDYYQRALTIAEEIGDQVGVAGFLNNLGNVYNQLQQHDRSETLLYQALDVLESLREGLTDAQKVAIFETQAKTYRLLQQALIAQNKVEEGLEISERGRARAFVELLAQKSDLEVQPLKIADIQKVAQEQQATLVEYSFVFNQQLYVWIVTPEGEVNFTSIDISTLDTPLSELVTISRQAIGVRGRGLTVVAAADFDPEENLQRLHEILIEPISQYLPDNREEKVIFMPQGSLFLVSFPALKDGDGNYLLDKHTILTAPAIQVLQLTHQQRPTGKDVLIVGNPTMPTVGIPPQQLSPLPGAEMEAKQVAELLGVQPLIGSQATKSAVLSQLSNAGIIHLATHGLLDNFGYDTPGAVALAPTGEDNGLLTAGEIIDLKLNADLVILSACNTGQGDLTGDGVVGLSRSLLTAGASSVIVSLWEVPDEPTAFLMTEFYHLREEGLDKAQALRQAMFKTRGKYPEPVNWAAFTLNGES